MFGLFIVTAVVTGELPIGRRPDTSRRLSGMVSGEVPRVVLGQT